MNVSKIALQALSLAILPAGVGFGQGPIRIVNDQGFGNLLGGVVQIQDGSYFAVLGDDGNNFPPPPGSSIVRITATGQSNTVFTFPTDGSQGLNPNALIQASDGNLYGTTRNGGSPSAQAGTIFRLSLGQGFATIHTFGGNDGSAPFGKLAQGSDGLLYGTTAAGGVNGKGTIFRISLAGQFETLYSFSGFDGAAPNGGLVELRGVWYGSTLLGGNVNTGTVFSFQPGDTAQMIHSFGIQHACPTALTLGNDGFLYGATADIALSPVDCSTPTVTRFGSLFRMDPAQAKFKTLISFPGTGIAPAFPSGPVLQATDGSLYGVSEVGGATEFNGTVYKYNPQGILTSSSFQGGGQGGAPCCELVQAISGSVIGVTQGFPNIEGVSPDSVVFAIDGLPKPVPIIQEFSPQSGSAGTLVTLRGDHFLATSQVSFNGATARFLVFSSNTIRAVVPARATSGRISVTNPGGTAISAGTFTVSH